MNRRQMLTAATAAVVLLPAAAPAVAGIEDQSSGYPLPDAYYTLQSLTQFGGERITVDTQSPEVVADLWSLREQGLINISAEMVGGASLRVINLQVTEEGLETVRRVRGRSVAEWRSWPEYQGMPEDSITWHARMAMDMQGRVTTYRRRPAS